MATRALICYFDSEINQITTTYNHYDGYPSNLGVGLETHYNDSEKAKLISNIGYISGMDGDTGEWKAIHIHTPSIIHVDELTSPLHIVVRYTDVEYVYIWDTRDNKWHTFPYYELDSLVNTWFTNKTES